MNVDEDPPPAPVAEVDAGLQKELERLEEKSADDADEIQETPEDGIIDDDALENDDKDEEAGSVKAEEDLKSGTTEDVLASGWNNTIWDLGGWWCSVYFKYDLCLFSRHKIRIFC